MNQRMGVCKRRAAVPEAVARLGRMVSKADLLEVAYWLAAAQGESCDDEDEAFSNLLAMSVHLREQRGARPLSVVKIITGQSVRDMARGAPR